MSKVFVLDTNKQPLNPVHPGKARRWLKAGKAAVFKRFPFTSGSGHSSLASKDGGILAAFRDVSRK